MEIQDQDGSKTQLSVSQLNKAVFGRASGFFDGDRSVSRRHVSFQVDTGPRVSFEVLGRNPVWVRRNEDDKIRVFRKSEKGELSEDDRFCVSAKQPTWFSLRRIGDDDGEPGNSDEDDAIGSPLEGFDCSDIDPVKEFGFVVMGHEFDRYPKHMIRDSEQWDWFLEDDRRESSDDDDREERFDQMDSKKSGRRKRKKGEEGDGDWTCESEGDEAVVDSARKLGRPKYSMRLKDRGKQPGSDAQKSRKFTQSYIASEEDDEDDDEEDTTLGGFIVGDEDVEREEEEMSSDDDEEELVEDEDDDEVDE